MITTGCDGCCFFENNNSGKGCVIGQVCVVSDSQTFAPGYCRMCRSSGWAKLQGTTDHEKLHRKVLLERHLKLDLLIYFNENTDTIESLDRTLQSDWYVKYTNKVIIMDTTGFGKRKNIALQYLKTRKHQIETIVDSSSDVETCDQKEDTIRRVSQQVASPFFLVLSAGNVLCELEAFALQIRHRYSRVIHWSFPRHVGMTAIVNHKLSSGLFITAPYKALMRPITVKSFTEQLFVEAKETEIQLSWLCENVWIS